MALLPTLRSENGRGEGMRLIDADALLKGKQDHTYISTHEIWNAPTVDAEPIKHGRWCKIDTRHTYKEWECSECGFHKRNKSHYCPNCGAKMDESEVEK